MKMLFECADRYLSESTWKDLALVKFCLCATGVMLGVFIPKEKRAFALGAAFAVFAVTYVPLMVKFFCVCRSVIREK